MWILDATSIYVEPEWKRAPCQIKNLCSIKVVKNVIKPCGNQHLLGVNALKIAFFFVYSTSYEGEVTTANFVLIMQEVPVGIRRHCHYTFLIRTSVWWNRSTVWFLVCVKAEAFWKNNLYFPRKVDPFYV